MLWFDVILKKSAWPFLRWSNLSDRIFTWTGSRFWHQITSFLPIVRILCSCIKIKCNFRNLWSYCEKASHIRECLLLSAIWKFQRKPFQNNAKSFPSLFFYLPKDILEVNLDQVGILLWLLCHRAMHYVVK